MTGVRQKPAAKGGKPKAAKGKAKTDAKAKASRVSRRVSEQRKLDDDTHNARSSDDEKSEQGEAEWNTDQDDEDNDDDKSEDSSVERPNQPSRDASPTPDNQEEGEILPERSTAEKDRTDAEVQSLLTNYSKMPKKFEMTRDGIHTFIAFCESNKLWKFDAKQMKSVWVTIVSKEMMRDIKFLLIGLADELRGTDDWERIYQYWVKGGWMNGKSSTATFAEMATFAKDKLLNRLQHHVNLVQQTEEELLKEATVELMKSLSDPKLLLGEANSSQVRASKTVSGIMERFETEPLKSYVESDEHSRKAVKDIWKAITEKEKTNAFVKAFRKFCVDGEPEWTHIDDVSQSLIRWGTETRKACETLRTALQISQTEFLKVLTKLLDPKVRARLLNDGYMPADRDLSSTATTTGRGRAGSNPNTSEKVKGGGGGGKNKPGPSAKKEAQPCKGCGVPTGTHGTDGDNCPYLKQGHPDSNDTDLSWKNSVKGKLYANENPPWIVWDKTLSGTPHKMLNAKQQRKAAEAAANPDATVGSKRAWTDVVKTKGSKGTSNELRQFICGLSEMEGIKTSSKRTIPKKIINPFLTMKIVNLHDRGQELHKEVKGALVDTGAIDANYISRRLVKVLEKSYGLVRETEIREVKTPDKSAAKFFTEGRVHLSVRLFDELKKKKRR